MGVVMTTSLWSLTGGNRKIVLSECYYYIAMAVDELLVFYILSLPWDITTYVAWSCYFLASCSCLPLTDIPYSGKLSREKTFMFWWLFAKVFSMKFGGMAPLALQKRPIHESFLHENSSFPQFTKVF